MNINKEDSPFTPGKPVPVDFFVGREKELKRIVRGINQVKACKQENLFIIGERGMGKTSLAAYIKYYAESRNDFIGVYVNLSGIKTLEEMTGVVFERFVKETHDKPVFSKIGDLFKDHIKQVGALGVTVQFQPNKQELKTLTTNFIPALRNIYEKVKDEKKGILLILDDINGIADEPQFAHFLKRTVDEIATSKPLPLFLVLVGMHEIRDRINQHQLSVSRIFKIIDIDRLSDSESREIFEKAFASRKIKVEEDAMNVMVRMSSGLPMLIQEVGDSVYWIDKDDAVDRRDALDGIFNAAENVGEKILNRQILNAIRSEKYISILKKMRNVVKIDIPFTKKDVVAVLSDDEKKNFNNFLQRMKKLDVMKSGEQQGEYEFTNNMFYAYLMIIADLGPKKQ